MFTSTTSKLTRRFPLEVFTFQQNTKANGAAIPTRDPAAAENWFVSIALHQQEAGNWCCSIFRNIFNNVDQKITAITAIF